MDDQTASGGPATTVWSLTGDANRSTVPPGGVTDVATARRVHGATQLVVVYQPGVAVLPDLHIDSEYFGTSTLTVGGAQATLTQPRDGIGNYRIDWVARGGYHVVMCERLATRDGRSGLDVAALIAIARSLHA